MVASFVVTSMLLGLGYLFVSLSSSANFTQLTKVADGMQPAAAVVSRHLRYSPSTTASTSTSTTTPSTSTTTSTTTFTTTTSTSSTTTTTTVTTTTSTTSTNTTTTLRTSLLELAVESAQPSSLPSHVSSLDMFVAVFTAPANVEKRRIVRNTWKIPENIIYKFVLCDDPAEPAVRSESDTFSDILLVRCTEGYWHGLLTRKLIATLRAYLADVRFGSAPFFFKTDDDTFVKLDEILNAIRRPGSEHIYAGRFYHGRPSLPIRTKGHKFEEPLEIFPQHKYPLNAAGGPGYVLDRGLIQYFIDKGVADQNVLWNEDKAVAVWADKAKSSKLNINFLTLKATDGYDKRHICYQAVQNPRVWSSTDYLMVHNVTGRQMACLREQSSSARLDQCECAWANHQVPSPASE